MFRFRLLSVVLLGAVLLASSGVGVLAQRGEVILNYATPYGDMGFDPAVYTQLPDGRCVLNTYDPLFMVAEGRAVIPHVGKYWTVSDDGLTYTIKIKPGIMFHDGTELTAEDVAFSMDRMLRIKRGQSSIWLAVLKPGDTEVVDKYTVAFQLKNRFAPFVSTLINFNIVNMHLLIEKKKPGDYGEFGDYGLEYLVSHDAGSGPYELESVDLGSQYVLTKYNEYFMGWTDTQIDRVIVSVIPEEATRVLLFKSQEIDMTTQWLSAESYMGLAQIEGVILEDDPSPQLLLLQMNNKKPPFDDVNVRKAVSYSLDYEAVITDILRGGEQAQGPVAILISGHADDVLVYHKDLDKAREFLGRSKYSMEELRGMDLEYVYMAGHAGEEKIGLVLGSGLEALGLRLVMKPTVVAMMLDRATSPETTPNFMAIYVSARYLSPDSHTYGLFHPTSWGNYMSCSWYENPEVTELLNRARIIPDTAERYALYKEAQRIIAEDAAALFVANPPHRVAHWDYIKGYTYPGPLGFDVKFYYLRMER